MPANTSTSIPLLLREVRGDRKKQDLAEELGVVPATYGRWERGESPFPAERLPWLAEAAGVDLDLLQASWKLDAGGRAMRKATPGDDADPYGVLMEVREQLSQIARVTAVLVDRVEALEGTAPRKAGQRRRA